MAQRIQQAPPRRRPTTIKATPASTSAPLDLSPPPIVEGVDAIVGWINRLNLQTIDLAQHQPQKHKALQALVAAFGRCRATARDVALLLQAREQRDRVPVAGAYATEPPLTDGLAMPLWHAFELVRLLYLVAQAPDVDKEDVAAIQTRIRHHVSGVTVREADATADFKRRHRIGSDVAGAVAGYAQIQAQLEKEALTAGDAEDARSDLIAFGHFMKSDYTSPWHVQVVCDALMRAERREVKGLIINMPPRRSKSTNATELFPAWLLGRHPTWDIIVGTHSQHFADSLGRKVRNMIQAAEYRRVFESISVAQDSSAAAQFEIVDETASARQRRGNFKAFGRGGAPAGSGANCFPAGTRVSTEIGLIPIEQLVQMGYNTPRVLSYDHKRKSPVWAKVLASSQRRAKGLVELTTSAGRRVVATSEHLVYSAGTWTEAKDLQPGDRVLIQSMARLPDVRGESLLQLSPMQEMRGTSSRCQVHSELLCMQRGICSTPLRSREESAQKIPVLLLQSSVLQQAQRDEAEQAMSAVRQVQEGAAEQSLLLSRLPTCGDAPEADAALSVLRNGFPADVRAAPILRANVCVESTLNSDDGVGQFTLQERRELPRLVREDAPVDFGERCPHLRRMWQARDLAFVCDTGYAKPTVGACHTPHRSESEEQPAGKSGDALRGVSWSSSQIEDDTVSMVRPLCDTEVDVYDIQVADHSCFFAESILVHNCLILDDFLSEQDAYSATERAKLLDDIIAFRTRLAPDAIWIVINTRYHEDDVVGVVKRDFADDREWTVITLPEFAEADEEWVVTTPATARRPAQRRVYTRKAGDVLWPDRFSAESSEQLKAALLKIAPHKWWGQFQCRPVPASGAMVDVSWFRRYDYADVMSIVKQAARVVVSVDCGGVKLHSRGSGAYGSRTAITVWAEWEDGRLYLIDVIASPWIYPDMIQAVKDACANWKPTDLLIENKAAGVELIRDLHEHRNWVQTPITPIDPFGPKETRMSVATPQIRAGQVYIPAQGACADIAAVRCAAPAWLEEFLTEMGHFPMGSRNDIVDSSSQMLNWRRDSPVWSNFSQVTASSPMKDQLMAAIAGPFGRRGGVVKPTMRIGSVRR